MNMRHLAVFHAVAEAGNLSRAAEALYITQPAASRQIKALEDALGLQLLHREPRGVRLTDAGQTLAGYAARIFALNDRARSVMEEIRNLKSGRLSLGASTTIGNYLLPPLLSRFRELHPGIEIRLEIGNTEAVQRQLLEDRIDLGFTEGFVEDEELEADIFTHDELAIIAAPDHPLARHGVADLTELCRHEWVMREPGSGTQAVLERIMQTHNLKLPTTFTLGNTEAVKCAVLAGAGIAGISHLTVANELRAGTLVRIHCEHCKDADFQRPLHRLRHRNHGNAPATMAFLKLLEENASVESLVARS